MADYRVYLLDTDGSFYSVVPLVCADDGEAIELLSGWPWIATLSFGN